MKHHLFLTGPIGCGKTTLLTQALGSRLSRAGGFLTVRRRAEDGRAADFRIMSPDGRGEEVFLDLTGREPRLKAEVFNKRGRELLEQAEGAPFAVLDEIGGIELLCPEFMAALNTLLKSDIPIIGVLKSEGSAVKLAKKLKLEGEYIQAAAQLHESLARDANTIICPCEPDPETAKNLTRKWVEEFANA